ncbi:MAG: endolytic transglycosylase MltG [Ruminococcus sp.]|jgi:UPF0755 protein|nr:endolytic transglycosylase MltG [Ruminococcus sp.]
MDENSKTREIESILSEIENNAESTDIDTDTGVEISEDTEDAEVSKTPLPLNTEKKALYDALLKSMDEIETPDEETSEIHDETDEEETLETEKRKRRRKKRSVGHLIFSIAMTAVIVSAAFLCAGFAINTAQEIMGIGRPETNIIIEVPETASVARIADMFMDEGIISDRDLFMFFAGVRGLETVIAGPHEFSANMTYGELADELQAAAIQEEREAVDITFPEGITLIEAGEILEAADICDADTFVTAFNSESFGFDFESQVLSSSKKFYKMEGYCFPDTYRLYSDEDVESIVKKIYRNFNNKITPDYYQRMEDMELTLDELITFASIVQAEAGHVSDMKDVASVFWNRLNDAEEFPRLQSDPTSNYVIDVIMPNIEVQSDEMFDAYNTYEGAGLPPGPICNPGIEAISAVLYPSETDYYYFCSNLETREFYYAKTLSEHEENLVLAGLVD